jgi:hypothetical protein
MPAYRDELVAIADKNHIAATDTNLLNLAQGKGACPREGDRDRAS